MNPTGLFDFSAKLRAAVRALDYDQAKSLLMSGFEGLGPAALARRGACTGAPAYLCTSLMTLCQAAPYTPILQRLMLDADLQLTPDDVATWFEPTSLDRIGHPSHQVRHAPNFLQEVFRLASHDLTALAIDLGLATSDVRFAYDFTSHGEVSYMRHEWLSPVADFLVRLATDPVKSPAMALARADVIVDFLNAGAKAECGTKWTNLVAYFLLEPPWCKENTEALKSLTLRLAASGHFDPESPVSEVEEEVAEEVVETNEPPREKFYLPDTVTYDTSVKGLPFNLVVRAGNLDGLVALLDTGADLVPAMQAAAITAAHTCGLEAPETVTDVNALEMAIGYIDSELNASAKAAEIRAHLMRRSIAAVQATEPMSNPPAARPARDRRL